jgi:hypothetical protein
LDIGFKVNGDLDDAALTTFIGNSDGYIVKWYDQSGTGLDAAQADETKQPLIATAGVINRENGKPVILYDGSNDNLKLSSWNRGTNATGFIVFKPTASETNTVALWEFGSNADAAYWAAAGNTIYDGFGTNSRRSVASPIDLDQQMNLASVQIKSNKSEYWLNGDPLMSPDNVSVDWSGTPTIGGVSNGLYWSGSISELVVYNKALKDVDRQSIEGSAGTYYGVAGTTGIITHPASGNQTSCKDNPAMALSVIAKGIDLKFQWYSNTTSNNSGGVLISGATQRTYAPSTAVLGQLYYYVTVTGSDGLIITSNVSGSVGVNPVPANGICLVTAGLVLHLDANDVASYPSTGNTWFDISGNSNNGTLNGTVFTTASGVSFFNFSNASVSTVIPKSTSMTFSAWAKSSDFNSKMLFNSGDDGSGPDLFFNSNNISWNTWDGESNPFGLATSSIDDHWHYYTIVNDASSSVATLYLDGVQVGTAAYRSSEYTNNFYIGAASSNNSYGWNGGVATFQVYNRALAPSEISQNFSGTKVNFGF